MPEVKVNNITTEAMDIVSIELIPLDDGRLPVASAGAHIDVHIDDNLVRQYSLINGPEEDHHYIIAVQKEPQSRGGSKAMHEQIKEGDVITISEPRNNFPLHDNVMHYTLLAGGIGITPILSMAKNLIAQKARFELHYCSRSENRTAFYDYILNSNLNEYSHIHCDDGPGDQLLNLNKFLSDRPEGGHLYICGPQGFMKAAESASQNAWPAETVHMEYFSADPGAFTTSTDSFHVKLAKSGETYLIPPDKSVVATLAEYGIEIPVSCEQGVCGTCLVDVLEGTPDHRDVFLSDKEKHRCDQFTPCVSRSKTAMLVIDM